MNSTLPSRTPVDRISSILESAGWRREGEQLVLRLELQSGTRSDLAAETWQRDSERLVVTDFLPGDRPVDPSQTPDSLFGRYLDLGLRERAALWSFGRNADLLLCLTAEGCSLLETADEVALVRWAEGSLEVGLASFARAVETPDLASRARPDAARLSGDLARWCDLFAGSMGPALKWARPDVRRLCEQLLLGLKSALAVRGSDFERNLARLGLTCAEGQGREIVFKSPASPDLVDLLLHEAAELAPHGAGAFAPLERAALVRQIRDLSDARQALVVEILQLASAKMQTSVQIPSVLPLEQEPESWRLGLLEPLRVQEEMESADFYVFQPLVLDLSECGFGRVLEAIEKLAAHAMKQNVDIRQAGGRQIDLIEQEPEGLTDRQTLDDPFNWLLRHALRLRVAPAYREAVGYLVASYVLELRGRREFSDCRRAPLVSLPCLFTS